MGVEQGAIHLFSGVEGEKQLTEKCNGFHLLGKEEF